MNNTPNGAKHLSRTIGNSSSRKKEGKNVIFRVSVTRKALDNLSEAPIEEILKKFKESGAMDKVGFF